MICSHHLHTSSLVLKVCKQKYIAWAIYYLSQVMKVFMIDVLSARLFWHALWYIENVKIMWNIWHNCFSVKCRNSKKYIYSEVELKQNWNLFLKVFLVWYTILRKFTLYTHQSLPHINKIFWKGLCLMVQQPQLIKHYVFLTVRTHLKKHSYDCQSNFY